jgi:hypothetical protein
MAEYDASKLPKKNILSAQLDLSQFEPATDEEKKQQDVMSKSTTFFRDGMRKLMKNPLAVASMVVLMLIILIILIAPAMISPTRYSEILSVDGKPRQGRQEPRPLHLQQARGAVHRQGRHALPAHLRHRRAVPRLLHPRRLRHPRLSERRLLREPHRAHHRHDLRQHLRLRRRANRPHHDAHRGYHLLAAGHADGHPAVRRAQEILKFKSGLVPRQAGLQHGLAVHRLRPSLLGRHGAPHPRPDPHDQGERLRARRPRRGRESGRIIKRHILPNCLSVIIISTALQIPSAIFTESYLSFVGLGVRRRCRRSARWPTPRARACSPTLTSWCSRRW